MIDLSKPLVAVWEDGSVEHVRLMSRGNDESWPDSDGDIGIVTSWGELYFYIPCDGTTYKYDNYTLRNATPDEIRAHVAAERERLDAMEAEANKPVVDAVTLWWREWHARTCDIYGIIGTAASTRDGTYDQPKVIAAMRTMPGFIEYAEKCVKEMDL